MAIFVIHSIFMVTVKRHLTVNRNSNLFYFIEMNFKYKMLIIAENINMVNINVSPEYGYVVMVGTGMVFVNLWKMMKIGGLRKKLNIKYPTMYSDEHPIFNCYQRAHQNTLEFVPFFYPALLTAGLRHPIGAAIAGSVFCIGRVIYAIGYQSGDPEKRVPGALISEVFGLLPLLGMSVSFGAGLLGWW